jgi:dihydroxyacetone kinase-like protein
MSGGDVVVTGELLHGWFSLAASMFQEQRDYLTQLDAAIGDADHGANMERGFAAVSTALDDTESTRPGCLLEVAGDALLSTVGGASGALWGTALLRAGRAVEDAETLDASTLVDALDCALAAIVELGAAEEGDKTMVDALGPAVRALRTAIDSGAGLPVALAAADAASSAGMRATIPLQATKGRASYLGERSIGHQDPGATSTALLIAALARTIRATRENVVDQHAP